MSKNAKHSKPQEDTQDMLIRVMTIARLLVGDKSKRNKQTDTKPDEPKTQKQESVVE
jgi:hypothetical protein